MTDLFHIEELDLADQPVGTPKVWYIKEGDFVHCTCLSEEAANLSVQHFKDLHETDKNLRKIKIAQETLNVQKHVFIVETELAAQAIRRFEALLDLEHIMQEKNDPAAKQNDPKTNLSSTSKNGLKS
ncbi:hypothetical protein [Pseudomonas sp. B19125]|uniref:hypothetical protein n=1 Tax=Pseudomonas sp. B19125 TaxID=3235109 RepID=UPI00378442D3